MKSSTINNLAISNEFGDIFILNDELSFRVLKKIPRSKIKGNTISFLDEFKGYLLIGTEKGTTIYKDEQFIFVNEEQGLQQPLLSAQVTENNLTIGSKNGYYTLNLAQLTNTEPLVHSLKLSGVYINNEFENVGYLAKNGILKLAYNQNTLAIKFTTNIHPFPNKLSYQYRLNSDESWSNSTASSEIYLPYLPAEKYEVEVKVTDLSTGLNYSQVLTEIKILPPFWKSWWFVLLSIVLVFVALFIFYELRIYQLKKFEAEKSLIRNLTKTL